MEKLEPPDLHFLSAAEGWMELGNPAEARIELDRIAAPLQGHPQVLEARWAICARAEDWPAALEVSQSLFQAAPDLSAAWFHHAYSLRRVPEGGLQAAWNALFPALEKFPREGIIPYNLACYACQLGQLDKARDLVKHAVKVAGKEQIKRMALSDPDLEPLWLEIQEM
jgi:tetratricopeptide (TPR) repeat protein